MLFLYRFFGCSSTISLSGIDVYKFAFAPLLARHTNVVYVGISMFYKEGAFK